MNWLWSPLYLYESLPTHMGRLGRTPKGSTERAVFSIGGAFILYMFAHLSAIHSSETLRVQKCFFFPFRVCFTTP